MLDFECAKKKLSRIAKGKYFSITYEESITSNKLHEVECRVYIDGEKGYTGSTWEAAFRARLLAAEPTPKPKSIKVGAPSKPNRKD